MVILDNGRLPVGTKGNVFLRVYNGEPREVELMDPRLKAAAIKAIETQYKVILRLTEPFWRQYGARPRVETAYIDGRPYPKYFPAPVLPFGCEVVRFDFLPG